MKPNEKRKDRHYDFLFVGNSFTHYFGMSNPDGIFKKITLGAGFDVDVVSVDRGGAYVRQFLDPEDEIGRRVSETLLSAKKYDFVLLQEQSSNPLRNRGEFFDGCRNFKKMTDANGAELFLYATWGYKDGFDELPLYGTDTFDMEMKLREAYNTIGNEIGSTVVNVGAGMSLMYKRFPDFDVFHTDRKHPSLIGCYLIAWTVFGTVFGVDPLSVDFDGELSPECSRAVRTVASEIVNNGAAVDKKYELQ